MPILHIKPGVEFRRDLYNARDRLPWLNAVGAELEARGVTVTVGEGAAAVDVKNAAELVAAYGELRRAARATGNTLQGYVGDLMNALDDIVKPTSSVIAGDRFDFSPHSDLSTQLGLGDRKAGNYAAASTPFGQSMRANAAGTISVLGARLQAKAVEPPPVQPPPVQPPPPGAVDLRVVPHLSTEAFAGIETVTARTGTEYDGTDVISGLSKQDAVRLATEALGDLQRSRGAAGFSVGTAEFDEMDWSSTGHAMRRSTGVLSLTLDNRSLELNPKTGAPRVAVGRDFFFDNGYAHVDLMTGRLTNRLADDANVMYRDRIRYGSDKDETTGTRVLIGVKSNTRIEGGEKVAEKIDSRTDSVTVELLRALSTDARSGKLSAGWGNWQAGKAAPAAREVYRAAVQAGLAQDYQGEHGVVDFEKAASLRQPRGRIHLNESDTDAVVTAFERAGEPVLTRLRALIADATDWPARNGLPSRAQLLAQTDALLDRSAIVVACTPLLARTHPGLAVDKALVDRVWPGAHVNAADALVQQQVADAIRASYDAFANTFDQLQRNVAGTDSRAVRDAGAAKDVMAWMRSKASVGVFMSFCESNATDSAVVVGTAATYKAYADKIVAMQDGKEKTALLQRIGIGTDQLSAMTPAALSSPVQMNAASFPARFVAYCAQHAADVGVTVGDVASYKAFAEHVIAMPDDAAKQAMLATLNTTAAQLGALTVANLSDPVDVTLTKKQIVEPFLAEFDAQLTGPHAAEFIAELATALSAADSPALSRAAQNPGAVLNNVRKNLVTAQVDVWHRNVEAAGSWAQAVAFSNVREQALGLSHGWGNLIISSLDFTEMYPAAVGDAMPFEDRVSRAPLTAYVDRMVGAKIGHDAQIELSSEQQYTGAKLAAQYAINAAVAGMIMQDALARAVPGVVHNDPATFETYLSANMAGADSKAFVRDVVALAAAKGSPIDVVVALTSLAEQVPAVALLTQFAVEKDPQLVATDRTAIETWFKQQANNNDGVDKLLDELAVFAAQHNSPVRVALSLINALDFEPFAAASAALPVDGHKALVDKKNLADAVWSAVLAGKSEYRAARGRECVAIAKDHGCADAGWAPPKEAKVDEAIRLVVG